jgi:hypothetical protein
MGSTRQLSMKRVSLIILVFFSFIPIAAHASTQVLLGQSSAVTASTATRAYRDIDGVSVAETTTNLNQDASSTIPVDGTISALYVGTSGGLYAPGTGTSYTITLFRDGGATALSCTISNTATSCDDLTHSLSVYAGDTLAIEDTESGTPAQVNLSWSMDFSPTNQNDTIFTGTGQYSSTTEQFGPIPGDYSVVGWSTNTNIRELLFPEAGTIDQLHTLLSQVNGVGSYDTMFEDNAASTTLTCNSGSNGVSCSIQVTLYQ